MERQRFDVPSYRQVSTHKQKNGQRVLMVHSAIYAALWIEALVHSWKYERRLRKPLSDTHASVFAI